MTFSVNLYKLSLLILGTTFINERTRNKYGLDLKTVFNQKIFSFLFNFE